MKRCAVLFLTAVILFCIWVVLPASAGEDATIVDEWVKVKVPAPPELKPVKIDVKTTALFVLDILTASCNAEKRPRCAATIPRIQYLLNTARDKGIPVIHSVTTKTKPADLSKEVAPRPGEPVIVASVDKFFNSDLLKILTDKGIKSVIITGTSANGAVLGTATGAAIRGIRPIVPVDTMSADDLYAEQYAAWHIVNAPSVRDLSILTRVGLISF